MVGQSLFATTRRRLVAAAIALGAVAVVGAAVAAGDVALDALLQRPAERGTIIVPDRHLRRWDPITVFFDAERGPPAGGAEHLAQQHARLAPAHPGAWTWLDARTLQFRPAEPWPPLASFVVEAAGKRARLMTLMPPPTRSVPANGATGLDAVDSITLTFADPIVPEALARMVAIELKELPGIGKAPARFLSAADFEVKALERQSKGDPAAYVLRLVQPIPLGTRATVRFHLAMGAADETTVGQVTFSTAVPFRVAAMGCGSQQVPVSPTGSLYPEEQALRCDAEREIRVTFTAAPSRLGPIEGRNLVRLDPAVAGLEFSLSGTVLSVRGELERETPYRVTLVPTPLEDAAGRRLELSGEAAVSLWFPRLDPYLRFKTSQVMAERRGPRELPLEGRGHGKVDLRIFRVEPLNRSFWPFPATPVSVDESSQPAGPGEAPEGWDSLGRISAPELRRRLHGLGSPALSAIVDLPVKSESAAADFGLDLAPYLARVSGRDQPGHYLVGVRALDGGSTRSWMRLQVTDLALSTYEEPEATEVLVTSLATGEPVAGAEVRIEGVEQLAQTEVWATLLSGRTDAAGRLRLAAPGPSLRPGRIERIVVSKDDDVLVLDAQQPPEAFADNHWNRRGGTWLGWMLQGTSGRGESVQRLCHLFPERPVYRPEEKVHIKGYARTRHQGKLAPIAGKGTVVVDGPGDEEWRFPVTLTSAGSFYAAFDDSEIPTGTYGVSFDLTGHGELCRAGFEVQAYRIPEFEVRLFGPEAAGSDRPFEVKLTASYYAGGQVSGRPVRWRVSQFPYTWAPKGRAGFVYSSDGRYSRQAGFESTPALEREAKTDDTGAARITLDPSIEPTAQPRTYMVEATVTGADGMTVTTTQAFRVVPAFVLGLALERFLPKAKVLEPKLLVAGPDGKLMAGKEVTVRLKQRQWHSHLTASDFTTGEAKYVTDVVDAPLAEKVVKSAAEPLALELPVPGAGVYIVELEAHDELGRAQVVTVDLYAGGDEPLTWDKPKAGVFELSADKRSYAPGDRAAVVIRSPYQSAQAMVVVEGPEANRYEWLDVRKGKAVFELAIERGWVPRLPLHVVLMRGRAVQAGRPSQRTDLGKPVTVASTLWLDIEPVENRVTVGLEHPAKAMPGKQIPVTVSLATPDGKPLAGEVTLWLVDQAVLALGKEARLDPLPDFITPRSSYLLVHDTRNQVLGHVPFATMPGGDGEEEAQEGELLDKVTVRRKFLSVPFYDPAIQVGAGGKATVTVQLPDNLTVFKLRAKAACGPDRFGVGKSEVAVRLPVIVQPALPRFVRPSDRFEVAAIGRVVEGKGGEGQAEARVDGLELKAKASRTVQLDPAKAERIAFPVTVPSPALDDSGRLARATVSVKLALKRRSDGAADAFEVALPLVDDRRPVMQRALVELVRGKGAEVEALAEAARPGSLRRQVVVSGEPGVLRMAAALDMLLRSPLHGTEQRLSRTRAFLGLRALRDRLHLGGDALAVADARLDEAVGRTLDWVPQVLDEHGLVAHWPGSRGSVMLTALALELLVEAAEKGYTVDAGLRAGLARTLRHGLRSDYRYFVSGESWYERTRALSALAAAGDLDDAYFSELARRADYLSSEGTAQVVLAAARAGKADSPTALDLVRRLSSAVTTRLYQGKEIYAGLKDGRTDRNPLILPSEARSLATITQALARVSPREAKLPLVVQALVELGGQDGWGNTNSDAAALLALAERLGQSSLPDSVVRVTAGGKATELALSSRQPVAQHALADGAAVQVLLESGLDRALLLATTQYLPVADGSKQKAEAAGFVVERAAAEVQPGGAPPRRTELTAPATELTYAAGTVVEEHVRVVNPRECHYAVVTVPLAAGMEPLNPALATAPPEATPTGRLTRAPSYVAFLDDRMVYYYDILPKGTYDFYFRSRAAFPGSFVQPAAHAELMYDRSVHGSSPGARVVVKAKPE